MKLILGVFILASVVLLPEIKLSGSLPTIQFVDILFPFIILILFIERKLLELSRFYFIGVLFLLYIVFTIIYNERQGVFRDYFELYKLFKWLTIVLFFSTIERGSFLNFHVKSIFVLVVVLNLFHYFNWFNFNWVIENYYGGGEHIKDFGLNSAGLPTYKRLLGLTGNPNVNSSMFAFFSILFYPSKHKKWQETIWFIIALFMMFLCQSRSALLSMLIVLLFSLFYKREEFKYQLRIIPIGIGVYLLSMFFTWIVSPQPPAFISDTVTLVQKKSFFKANSYSNSLFTQKINSHASMAGREEVWKQLWEMIKEKPFFGHAPNKEYFYNNNLHAENEYVLQTWRYGFVGLFIFICLVLTPTIMALKKSKREYTSKMIQLTLFYMIFSLTNAPFSNRITIILFAIMIGVFFNNTKKELQITNS
ncbi:O-antigen ligase family protein [Flavobacteriales bacterium]|nr:O-antigen ligase family protein [Flavobacteriales bacterium]